MMRSAFLETSRAGSPGLAGLIRPDLVRPGARLPEEIRRLSG